VRSARRLPLASTSVVDAVDVETADGHVERLVLRRYAFPEVLLSEPDAVRREATVLATTEGTAVRAPRVVAIDPDATSCDVPALLMTRLPGRTRWRARVLDGFVEGLASQLPAVHAVPLPSATGFPTYRGYHADREPTPPPWTRVPRAWAAAIACHRAGPPACEPTFIHRDYHAGNVLWSAGTVSGIVDWAWACRGPASIDVSHCRVNLALASGTEVADAFLDCWRSEAGTPDPDPRWDLIDAVDMLPHLRASHAALTRLDAFVARAAAAIAG
jgi:aminoglycoside phosphotransferase (APT) family kinase protein